MKIVAGPGEYKLNKSLESNGTVNEKRCRIMFKVDYRGSLAGHMMAITSLSPREDEKNVFDFSAEDAMGQTFKGWYNCVSKEGEMEIAD